MDTKDGSAVLLKTIGLAMIAYAIFEIPLYFPPRSSPTGDFSVFAAVAHAAAVLTLPIALGRALWFFPAKVTNKIVSGDKLSGERFGAPELERVALTVSVIGAWLVAYGIADLIYDISTVVVLQREYAEQAPPLSRYLPGVITSISKVGLGLGLALGAKGIARFIYRVRGEAFPFAQPDWPALVFNLASIGAARRLARTLAAERLFA